MLRLSSGLQNALLKDKTQVVYLAHSTTMSIVAGGGADGSDRINDATALATFPANLHVGDSITILGADVNAYKAGIIVGYGVGYMDVSGAAMADMTIGADAYLVGAVGGSLAGIFRNGVIRIYTGTQPASANSGETGTLLCEITMNSQAHSVGLSGTNGLVFGNPAGGVLGKRNGDIWSGLNLATGTAGWFRLYANDKTLGDSTTAVRTDGSCSTSGGQLKLSSTNLVSGVTTTVDGVQISMPAN